MVKICYLLACLNLLIVWHSNYDLVAVYIVLFWMDELGSFLSRLSHSALPLLLLRAVA